MENPREVQRRTKKKEDPCWPVCGPRFLQMDISPLCGGHLCWVGTAHQCLQWCADSTCTAFSHLFFNILFDSINHSHVHMYISHWGPEEQSPSLEINFDSTNLMHLYPACSAGRGIHSMKEVETGEPMQSLSSLPSPHLGTHMHY